MELPARGGGLCDGRPGQRTDQAEDRFCRDAREFLIIREDYGTLSPTHSDVYGRRLRLFLDD